MRRTIGLITTLLAVFTAAPTNAAALYTTGINRGGQFI